jgi:FMN phosphatase YigB (HAD superfamily)
MQQFKNLIFDIGDVIVDIDYQTTIAEFQKLSLVDFSQIVSYSKQNHIFDLLETGKITAQQFRDELKRFLKPGTTDEEITRAWNSILINYPAQKIDLLKELKSRYKTFALSNINEIHVSSIDKVAHEKFGADSFGSFFHQAYYSNEVGFRKPDKEIYEFVLQKENLIAGETFFVDDKAENIAAAKELGIHAYQLTDRNKLNELLTDLKII